MVYRNTLPSSELGGNVQHPQRERGYQIDDQRTFSLLVLSAL